MKKKTSLNKIMGKKIIWLTILGIISGLVIVLLFSEISELSKKEGEESQGYLAESKIFCDRLKINRSLCEEKKNECSRMTINRAGLIDCLSFSLSSVDLNASQQTCLLHDSEDHLKFCLAHTLIEFDTDAAMEQCDLIEEPGTKAHCLGDVFMYIGQIGRALEECENLKDSDELYFCKARVSPVEEAKAYCNKMIDAGRKHECLTFYGTS